MVDPESTERLLADVIAATDLVVLVWQVESDGPGDSTLLYASPVVESLIGRRPDDVVGLPARAIFPDVDTFDKIEQFFEVATGAPTRDMGETELTWPSGHTGVYRVTLHPLAGDRLVVLARDITARLRTGDDVLIALNSMSDAFYIYDRDWRYTFVNTAGERFAQTPKEKMIGQLVWDVFPEIVGTPVQETMLRAAREKTTTYTEARPAYADLWYSLWAYPTSNGAAVYMQDITELKRLEEQLQQAQKLDAVARLAGTVAHDFNNALTAIRTATALARESTALDEVRSDLERVDAIAADAAALTEQLLTLARTQPLPTTPTSVHEVLAEMHPLMMSLVTESIDLTVQPGAMSDLVSVDPSRLRQTVLNLLLNARDALGGSGRVTLATTNRTVKPGQRLEVDPGEYLALSCEDDGVGMSPDVVSRAFEPFFTTRDEGTGLGLTSVHRVIKDAGGDIQITSEEGHGTTVTVLMPLAPAIVADDTTPAAASLPSPAKHATILLVEDDDDVRPLLARALQRLGHEVLVAASGHEAIALAAETSGPIDLVLTDVLMPGLSGAQVAEQLRESRPEMKVLYMSGYASDELARRGINDATVYLQKPFQVRDLEARITSALD